MKIVFSIYFSTCTVFPEQLRTFSFQNYLTQKIVMVRVCTLARTDRDRACGAHWSRKSLGMVHASSHFENTRKKNHVSEGMARASVKAKRMCHEWRRKNKIKRDHHTNSKNKNNKGWVERTATATKVGLNANGTATTTCTCTL